MTRSFTNQTVPAALLDDIVDLASRSPSAGKTQGWHLIVLEGDQTDRFWRHAFPITGRDGFTWPGLFTAPVIALAFADPTAYVDRYGEPDKISTGLGTSVEAWPTPYWTIDASMALMTLLLGAEDAGLGALLFAVFRGEQEVRAELGVPSGLQLLGAIALGWPDRTPLQAGTSAGRSRRTPAGIIHHDRW